MSRYIIALVLLILLVMQGMAMSLLPANLIYSDLLIIPHWVLSFILLIAVFYDRDGTYHAVWYGLVYGLLIDVVYTGVLGIYMVTYALIAYTIHGLKRLVHGNFFTASLLGLLGVVLADTLLYIIYSFVQISSMTWVTYAMMRLLPTLSANMIFFVILYPLVKKRMLLWSEDINNA